MRQETISYLELAEQLSADLSFEGNLMIAAATVSPLTPDLLTYLSQESARMSLSQPRLGWALMAVADAAATHQPDPLLQAKAAWHMGRAANEWVQPQRVAAAMDKAQPLFAAAGETGWVAACVWQRNALPWSRPSFVQAQAELETAMTGLKASPELAYFLPHCGLSLAYAHLLNLAFEPSLKLIDESEVAFKAEGDLLNQARCWYTKAACFRRKNNFEMAMAFTQEALDCFTELNALGDLARTKCQLAFNHWLLKADYAAARQELHQAIELFTQLDMPVWITQCYQALGQIYYKTGDLTASQNSYQQATSLLQAYEQTGSLLGDTLYDMAVTETQRGNYAKSLELLQEAQNLVEKNDLNYLRPLILGARGTIYNNLGRYQDALALLEQTHHYYEEVDILGRLAIAELNLAEVWLGLGQPDNAKDYLDKALKNSQEAQQADLADRIIISRAEIFLKQNKPKLAIQLLETTLAQAQKERPQLAAMHRWLGQSFCADKAWAKAEIHLQKATALFQEMEMEMEMAICQLAWGRYYQMKGDFAAAAAAWNLALTISQNLIPDIAWQAHAGLAELAEQQEDHSLAIEAYNQMMAALAGLREGLTQLSLSGSFFSQPSLSVDRAVHLAIKMKLHTQALHYMEASKAITLARLLHTDIQRLTNLPAPYNQQLADLTAEIRSLQERFHPNASSPMLSSEERQWRQSLKQKAKEYDWLISQLERHLSTTELPSLPTRRFDQTGFQQLATQFLGHNWVAVDYYLTESHLFGIMLTADSCDSWSTSLSARDELALSMIKRANPNHVGFAETDFKTLANLLLPPELRQKLQPDTTLLIAPHDDLHRIPWSALRLDSLNSPLVMACVPVIIPSLNSLSVLWQRAKPQPYTLGDGLLIAVSDFQGRHQALPAVRREAMALIKGLNGQVATERCDAAATWENVRQLSQGQGLQAYSWLHVASHAFHDGLTGRLSGLALHDRDIWLDEFSACAPLPPLVTLSVCSGIRGRVFAGDEQVGLTTTCLVAGAQTVISSLWPLLDETTPELIIDFYEQVAAGKSIALALALAQRNACRSGVDVTQWSSFCCVGQP
jgi:CHAT domain-containing protein/tetratricopeptide (TPR) repeat protein